MGSPLYQREGSIRQPTGMTINSFSSVSLDPPLILWSISNNSRAFSVFSIAAEFMVNILAWDQVDVARHFASSGPHRSNDAEFFMQKTEPLLLDGAVAHLECCLENTFDGGDHTILIGRVKSFHRNGGKPLLFVQGQYGVHEAHPDFISENSSRTRQTESTVSSADILSEIFDARNLLSQRFEKYHLLEGISLAQNKVLRRIHDNPGSNRDMLLNKTFLGDLQLDEAISELLRKRWVRQDPEGRYTLTEQGLERREAIRNRWDEFQREQTHEINEPDISIARDVLNKIINFS
ncbi:flavin reductase [Ochrobactrum teleogrylli]